MFYHVADSSTTVTYLLSYFVLSNLNVNLAQFPTITNPFPPAGIDYLTTADFLCYGSPSQNIVNFILFSFKLICVKVTLYGQHGSEFLFTGFTT
jgi:hypothetical protein